MHVILTREMYSTSHTLADPDVFGYIAERAELRARLHPETPASFLALACAAHCRGSCAGRDVGRSPTDESGEGAIAATLSRALARAAKRRITVQGKDACQCRVAILGSLHAASAVEAPQAVSHAQMIDLRSP